MQLEGTVRPVGQAMRQGKGRRVHGAGYIVRTKIEQEGDLAVPPKPMHRKMAVPLCRVVCSRSGQEHPGRERPPRRTSGVLNTQTVLQKRCAVREAGVLRFLLSITRLLNQQPENETDLRDAQAPDS